MSSDPIGLWIDQIHQGNDEVAKLIWDRYFPDLVRAARFKLQDVRCTVEDEEDVALSVLDSFLDAAKQGRFPDLTDDGNLWRLLSWMTQCKVIDRIRRRRREKEVGESGVEAGGSSMRGGMAGVADHGRAPDVAATFTDVIRALIEKLEEPDWQAVARAKLEGLTHREIATRLGCSVSTVDRRVRLIRRIWEREVHDEPHGE